VEREEAIRRLEEARVGSMATLRPDGTPHVIPFVFALVSEGVALRVYWAVDHKTKRSAELQRLVNLRAHPAVEIEVNGYDDEWRRLWWVRASGSGREVGSQVEREGAIAALCARYAQYRERPPAGPVVAIDIDRVTGWTGTSPSSGV
jgi:PPOX class probable F420-dependent enzyme